MGLSQAGGGEVVTRFAPSPTGYLHAGHALAARIAWQRAREAGGRFLVRLEDIDPTRCRPEYADAIFEDLRWPGLTWAETCWSSLSVCHSIAPAGSAGCTRPLYPCFCSRAEVAASATAPQGPDGAPVYPGTCRNVPAGMRETRRIEGHPHAWRLHMARALTGVPALFFEDEGAGRVRAIPEAFGDVVLARRDAPASYHLCVTYDDAAQGVTR